MIVEDGSLVADANSYVTAAEARTYAVARGVMLSAVDADVEKLLIKACDFLDTFEARYKGVRVDATQALAWPRAQVYLFDSETLFPETEIPELLKRAQCQLAIDAVSIDLQPTESGREVLREKIDVIETEYAKGSSLQPNPVKALGMLELLFNSAGFSLRSIRI